MALIVEDGTGFNDAESYISVTEADAYHLSRGNTAWENLDDEVKEQNLRRATEYLDAVYGARWLGDTAFEGQSLDWPRSSVLTDTERTTYWTPFSYYLATSPLPKQLRRATAELALKSATGTELTPDQGPAVKQETVGPITVIYQDKAVNVVSFSGVQSLLTPLLTKTGSVRFVRG